jgi:trehalose 6-phosphate phosphatase
MDQAIQALCAEPARAGLLLDFDGVLSPIVADPTTSRMADGADQSLARIAHHLRVVAVVSGRPVEFLADRAGVPGLRLLGSYGVEELRDGVVTRHPGVTPWLAAVAEATSELRAAVADLPGVRVEEKGGVAVAVH